MLNGKERALLRSEASRLDAIFQVGKGGVGDAAVRSISDALEARELVKVSVLLNAGEDPRGTGEELAARCGAELVAMIGRKAILYRPSAKPEKRRYSLLLESAGREAGKGKR